MLKYNYNLHLQTNKHKLNVLIFDNKIKPNQCNNCKKIYSSNKNLWRHKKTCIVSQSLSNDITFVDTI